MSPRLIADCALSEDEAVEGHDTHFVPKGSPPAVTTPNSRPYRRRTEAERLVPENQRLIADLPAKRHSPTSHQTSYMSATNHTDQTACPQNKLTEDEKRQAYDLEKKSWIEARAFDRLLKTSTIPTSNIIGSQVIYKLESDGTSKARIVPWGHRELDKEQVRGDAPSFILDSMRPFFSLAAEHQ